MSFIEINNIWKEYGPHVILERLNIQVEKGEFITIVGASGCGKTTFLKLLLGTETATRGELTLEGKKILDEPSDERGIVFQKYSVFPHLNVLENVLIGVEFEQSKYLSRLFGKKKSDARKEAEEILKAVGLGHAIRKFPHELSGGMQQRLALAQALIKKPKILLLDEPFGALDPGIRQDMHALVLNLWREHQLTIFMITHDLKEGFYLGTRLWVFDKTRHDEHSPESYGATITFDLPVTRCSEDDFSEIETSMKKNKSQPA